MTTESLRLGIKYINTCTYCKPFVYRIQGYKYIRIDIRKSIKRYHQCFAYEVSPRAHGALTGKDILVHRSRAKDLDIKNRPLEKWPWLEPLNKVWQLFHVIAGSVAAAAWRFQAA